MFLATKLNKRINLLLIQKSPIHTNDINLLESLKKNYIKVVMPNNYIIFITVFNLCILVLYFFIDLDTNTISLQIFGKDTSLAIFYIIPILFFIINSVSIDIKNLLNIKTKVAKIIKAIFKIFSVYVIMLNSVIFRAAYNLFIENKSILFNKNNILIERSSTSEQFFNYVKSKYKSFKKDKYYDVDLILDDSEKNQWYLEWLALGNNKFLERTDFLEYKFSTYYYYKSTTVLTRFFNNIADFINNTPYIKFLLDQKFIWITGIIVTLGVSIVTGRIDKLWERTKAFFNFGDSLAEANTRLLRSQNDLIMNNIARISNLEVIIGPLPGFLENQRDLNSATESALLSQSYENGLLMYLIKRSFELTTLLTYSSINGIDLPRDNQIQIIFYLNKLMQEVFINRHQGDPIAFVDNNQGNIPILVSALDKLLEQFIAKISAESQHPISFDQLRRK